MSATTADRSRALGQVTVDNLPDNVLLEIFYFHTEHFLFHDAYTSPSWNQLTQVCRRWRYIVLESPRRLDLRVICSDRTPTRASLDIWPPFPIIIFYYRNPGPPRLAAPVDEQGVQNLIAALEHRDRTFEIFFVSMEVSVFEKLVAVMQEPLPALKKFRVIISDELHVAPALPETFLGGYAPRLESLSLGGIGFPSLPRLISSATHITDLCLLHIPDSGYISPEDMATCVAMLLNLECLSIGFQSPLSRPLRISPLPLTRAVLPALLDFSFGGVSEYFEDLVSRIDTPLLGLLHVTFFMDLIFDIPRLRNFINRAEFLGPFNQAEMVFYGPLIEMILGSPTSSRFQLEIKCERPDWQLSSMMQIFNQQLPLLFHVEELEIREPRFTPLRWKNDPDMGPSQWLELFHLFISVQSLYVSESLVPPVAAALRDITRETAMEVLPALCNLWLEGLQSSGPVQEGLNTFVAARQLSDHPIVIRRWEP